MIKIILGLVILVSVVAQDAIICSGFIRILKADRQDINVNQIEMKLLGSNNQFIDYIEISENGFYSIEIEDDGTPLIDYVVFIQPKVKGFVASPSQINLKFQSKTFDEASSFCNKQLNFSIKRAPVEEPKQQQQQQQQQEQQQHREQQQQKEQQQQQQQQQEITQTQEEKIEQQQQQVEIDQNIEYIVSKTNDQDYNQNYDEKQDNEQGKEQIQPDEIQEELLNEDIDEKSFDHFRLIGQIVFEGDFTLTEKNLYFIKSFKVFDNLDEQVQGRTLSFQNYFEVETNEAKTLKLQLVVEKTKEKGESVNKQINFEQKISKISLLNRQITAQPVVFAIKKETPQKEQNKIGQVFAPLLIFGLVLAMFNYDKILKKK
ncbi:unnamed protein product (macronuclear) [Paramecium tetraurelia]|uniref:Transmembrane protein n=1 Tax=Paramecium tetraurelia TaxID=5888 RepID=A0DS59_PARTE|nr:uncharacterized protein GSPATT00019580001 [Paramecium tetraurelia]CAK85876.1 unnamed protein product [Paramecium tetraurelia]|eukprot:XP_001453273.1 hypothetical protein (macronuclear) [Paramecium tetraurelia strain d4-2]